MQRAIKLLLSLQMVVVVNQLSAQGSESGAGSTSGVTVVTPTSNGSNSGGTAGVTITPGPPPQALSAEEAAKRSQMENAARAKTVQEFQPPAAQEKLIKDIQNASEGGKVKASTVDELIRKAKLDLAREKLAELSKSGSGGSSNSGNAGSSGKSSGGSSGGAAHGALSGLGGLSTGVNFEDFQSRSTPIQKDINDYSNSLSEYTTTASGLLSDRSLERIQNSFIDSARNSIGMPRGAEKALSDNFLFQSLNDDAKNSLKESFLGLVKNSAADKAPTADLPYLKDIVSDTNFQFTAEKILGAENLSYLNLATISADMLNIKSLTGAAYSSFLNLTEGSIAGAKASVSVSDWMQAADFLSSRTFLASTRDAEFSALMRKGFADLNETYKRLAAMKSLDFLDLLEEKNKKTDLKKVLDAGVINAIAALKQAKRLKAREGWEGGMLSNFEYFQKHISETLNEVAKVNSSEELLPIFDKVLSNNSLRAYWRSFDYPGYFKYRRSVASVYFSVKFKDFDKFKIAPQTAPDLAFGKIPKDYPKDNPMFFVTAVAMDYVKTQKDRSKGLADQEKAEDKKYLVKQLASDKYYSSLEDEKN